MSLSEMASSRSVFGHARQAGPQLEVAETTATHSGGSSVTWLPLGALNRTRPRGARQVKEAF